MKEETRKILVGLGLTLLGAFGIYKFVKAYKKGMAELETQETQETDDLQAVGINTDAVKREVDNEERDFIRMLFSAVRHDSEIDEDLFDIDSAIEKLDSRVIHVRQINTTGKHNEPRRALEFSIDIPDYTSESFRGPKIGNFLTVFSQTANLLSNDIVKFSPKARHKLIGFVVISRKNESGISKIEYRQLNESVYGKYADEKHDGLTKFYETEKPLLNTTGAYNYIKDAKWLFINCPDLKEDDESLLIENIVLQYIISFPIRSNKPGETFGIDVKTTVECIRYLTEKMYVGREDSRNAITYRNVMFNAPNDNGIPDLSWYYTVDEETGNIIVENICEFYDEEEDA